MTRKNSSLVTDALMGTKRLEYSESKYHTAYMSRGGIAVVWLGQRVKPSINGTGSIGGLVAMKQFPKQNN